MGVHSGTHIDAPFHFLNDGASIDTIPIETYIGSCLVVNIDADKLITKDDLPSNKLGSHTRILFKTKNSDAWEKCSGFFNTDFVSLGLDAAQYLLELKFNFIGIDSLSIEAFDSKDNVVHRLLLGSNVTILEGLNLFGVEPGEYELICLPMRLQDCDGAPARVLLREYS